VNKNLLRLLAWLLVLSAAFCTFVAMRQGCGPPRPLELQLAEE
jgi:hypothetical protein